MIMNEYALEYTINRDMESGSGYAWGIIDVIVWGK